MTEQTPILAAPAMTGQAFTHAEIAAATIAREMLTAFWLESCGRTTQVSIGIADSKLRALAALMGYDLAPKAKREADARHVEKVRWEIAGGIIRECQDGIAPATAQAVAEALIAYRIPHVQAVI
jgi:hypothetical protein